MVFEFEMDYQRLFETNANQANDTLPDSVDAKIILTSTRTFSMSNLNQNITIELISKV